MPSDDIVVFIIKSRDSRCSECGGEIGKHGFLRKEGERGLCLSCADMGGADRLDARHSVRPEVDRVLETWRGR